MIEIKADLYLSKILVQAVDPEVACEPAPAPFSLSPGL